MSKELKQRDRLDFIHTFDSKINYQITKREKQIDSLSASQNSLFRKRKILKIKPVESDMSDDEVYQQPQTYLESDNIFIQPIQSKPEKSNEKNCISVSTEQKIEKNYQQMSALIGQKYKQNENLPKQCLQILKQQKKQAYYLIINMLKKYLDGFLKKNIIIISGNKHTGKKTLLFEAIKQIKQRFQYQVSIFYLNFQIVRHKSKSELIQLCKYLKEKQVIQEIKYHLPRKDFIIINNIQLFIYNLKKINMFHEFKTLIKKSKCLLIIIDKKTINFKSGQLWIKQNCFQIQVKDNSKQFISHSFTTYINQYKWTNIKWTVHRPLINFLCHKLEEQNALNLQIISKFVTFLLSEPITTSCNGQKPENICKVSRQILSSFSSISFDERSQIEISKLNFHQNCVIISMYLYLIEHQQIVISLSQIDKVYRWCCESLGVDPKSLKQLEKDVLDQLQTYRLISLSRNSSRQSQIQILMKIDLQTIKEKFSKQLLFRKFFKSN